MVHSTEETASSLDITPLPGVYFVRGLGAPEPNGRHLTLILGGDGAAVLTTEYPGRGILLERGSWRARENQVEIVWTDLEGTSIHLRMNFEVEGSELVYVGPDPAAFGEFEIRLKRVA